MRRGRLSCVGSSCGLRAAQGLLALAFALGVSTTAQALSLSELKSVSAIGEPLRLELIIEAERDIPPKVRLLPFGDNGRIDLESLRFQLEPIDRDHQRLLILSSRPVWEPAIELSVEVAHDQMRIRRDLSVLLDLPDTAAPALANLASPRASPMVAASMAPEAVIEAASEAAAASPPPRSVSMPRKTTRRSAAPAAVALQPPPPRFQLSHRLSDNWAELVAGPAPAASAVPESVSGFNVSPLAEAQAAAPERAVAAARSVSEPSPAPTRAVVSALDEQVQRARSIDDAGSLYIQSPWLLFSLLAGLATAMFLQARRLRRQMMREDELVPA